MTTDDTFTTDSSPGEQAFESTVTDAVAFFEAAFDANEHWYGARMAGALRGCVRMALASDGSVSPEQVAHELSDKVSVRLIPVAAFFCAMVAVSHAGWYGYLRWKAGPSNQSDADSHGTPLDSELSTDSERGDS